VTIRIRSRLIQDMYNSKTPFPFHLLNTLRGFSMAGNLKRAPTIRQFDLASNSNAIGAQPLTLDRSESTV